MLTGTIRKFEDLDPTDFRRYLPRWSPENIAHNVAIADKFVALAKDKGCTPSQLVLSWVTEQGVIPIFGTRTSARVEENFGASTVVLSADDLAAIDKLIKANTPAGLRYPEQMMASVVN
jgi:aryl-alcohol dehydrogenase-like predicted oxidoreductase